MYLVAKVKFYELMMLIDLRIVLENTEYQIEDKTNPKKCSNVTPDCKT